MTAGAEMAAAGGAVWRRRADGIIEVVLVHRPGHDDWSLPKGKAEAGEEDLACALREVEEETAMRCRLGPELGRVAYLDRDGRRKAVRYWAMVPLEIGIHQPDEEIDEVRWLPLAEARSWLTYETDGAVLDALEAFLA